MEAEYLNAKDASRYVGMSRDSFYKYVAYQVNVYVIGKMKRYKKSDLDRFMKSNQWEC